MTEDVQAPLLNSGFKLRHWLTTGGRTILALEEAAARTAALNKNHQKTQRDSSSRR